MENMQKGKPVTLTIDNMGQLSLEKLSYIEKSSDIAEIVIQEKSKFAYIKQGEERPLSLENYKQIRTTIDDIISHLYIDESASRMFIDFQLAVQIIDNIARKIEYDNEATMVPIGSDKLANASGMMGLITGKAICRGDAEILRNILNCVGIECITIDGTDAHDGNHSWNQVKLGDTWFNVDLTYAREAIREARPSGDLFMSDVAFFRHREKYTFDKGKMSGDKKMETKVKIGGHSSNVYDSRNKACDTYIPPYVTLQLIKQSRHYENEYKKECNTPNYKGVKPYVGSSIQKMQNNATKNEENSYLEH